MIEFAADAELDGFFLFLGPSATAAAEAGAAVATAAVAFFLEADAAEEGLNDKFRMKEKIEAATRAALANLLLVDLPPLSPPSFWGRSRRPCFSGLGIFSLLAGAVEAAEERTEDALVEGFLLESGPADEVDRQDAAGKYTAAHVASWASVVSQTSPPRWRHF